MSVCVVVVCWLLSWGASQSLCPTKSSIIVTGNPTINITINPSLYTRHIWATAEKHTTQSLPFSTWCVIQPVTLQKPSSSANIIYTNFIPPWVSVSVRLSQRDTSCLCFGCLLALPPASRHNEAPGNSRPGRWPGWWAGYRWFVVEMEDVGMVRAVK